MKKSIVLILAAAGLAFGQAAPNCNQLGVTLLTAVPGTNYNNTGNQKCVVWTLAYFAEGFGALSIQLEQAPDNGGVPGAFSAISSTFVSNGTNPLTSTTSGNLTVNGYFAWIRVNLTSATGTGFVNFSLIGNAYIGPSSSVTSAATGVASNVNLTQVGGAAVALGQNNMAGSIPVVVASNQSAQVVDGPDAPGVAPTQNPVQVSGFDGTNVRRIRTDGTGFLAVGGEAASGAAPVGNPVYIGGNNNGVNVQPLQVDGSGAAFITYYTTNDIDGLPAVAGSARNTGTGFAGVASYLHLFNATGSTFDKQREATLTAFPTSTTLTARNSVGAALTEKGSRWSVVSNPAAGNQASASIASEASVRHVVDCVSFSASAGAAPTLTALTLNIRDGASGAGTVIWTWNLEIAAATGQSVVPHSICGLNLVGTTATAMTVEFSASLANLAESVSISGYNVN